MCYLYQALAFHYLLVASKHHRCRIAIRLELEHIVRGYLHYSPKVLTIGILAPISNVSHDVTGQKEEEGISA